LRNFDFLKEKEKKRCRLAASEFSSRRIPFEIRHGLMQFGPQKQSVFEQYTIFQKETFRAIFNNFHHQSSRLPLFFPNQFLVNFLDESGH
jgi:hypothetical protein